MTFREQVAPRRFCRNSSWSQARQSSLYAPRRPRAAGIVPVPHQDFFQAALSSDGTIVLNDARIVLAVEKADALTVTGTRGERWRDLFAQRGSPAPQQVSAENLWARRTLQILNLTRGMDGVRYARILCEGCDRRCPGTGP
ncbi:MAG: hypothetical protein MZU91_02565 [Desulfosudis oleivorans]|nr:hypothetical protein [Desulfosudis oleivorans]